MKLQYLKKSINIASLSDVAVLKQATEKIFKAMSQRDRMIEQIYDFIHGSESDEMYCVMVELVNRLDDNIGDFTNQNATQPETSPEVICSQSASLRMLGTELQRVFFTFRTRGWHLQRYQKT